MYFTAHLVSRMIAIARKANICGCSYRDYGCKHNAAALCEFYCDTITPYRDGLIVNVYIYEHWSFANNRRVICIRSCRHI